MLGSNSVRTCTFKSFFSSSSSLVMNTYDMEQVLSNDSKLLSQTTQLNTHNPCLLGNVSPLLWTYLMEWVLAIGNEAHHHSNFTRKSSKKLIIIHEGQCPFTSAMMPLRATLLMATTLEHSSIGMECTTKAIQCLSLMNHLTFHNK